MNALSDTAQFRTIAKEVVGNQQRVCAVQMKNIEDKLDGVIEDVATVKKDVGTMKTDMAVIKSRIAIGAVIIGSLVGGIPMVVDLIRSLISK